MKRSAHIQTFLRGLETTGREDGLELPAWSTFQNVRVEDGAASPRPGMQLVKKFEPTTNTCLDFSGSSQYLTVPLDTRVHTLGLYWTLEMLFEPDSVSGTQGLIGWGTTSPLYVYLDTTSLKVAVTLSGPATTTKAHTATIATGTTYALQVTRDNATLYINLNGVEVTQALTEDLEHVTPGGSLLFATDDSSNEYTGKIDYVRLFDTVWRDGVGAGLSNVWRRFHAPRARYVLWDYLFQATGGGFIEDRSRFENHAILTGSPATPAGLSLNHAPVHMIHPRLDWGGKTYLDIVAGRVLFHSEIGR